MLELQLDSRRPGPDVAADFELPTEGSRDCNIRRVAIVCEAFVFTWRFFERKRVLHELFGEE